MEINYTFYFFAFFEKVIKKLLTFCYWRSGNERLTNRLEEVLEENRELRTIATDFGRVKSVVGVEQVNAVIDRAKQQEQIEAEQKRAARRKYSREAR